MAGQSRVQSFLEALTNNVVGFLLGMVVQATMVPITIGCHVPLKANIVIGVGFALVSFIRSYTLRRVFNWWHHRSIT